MRLLVLHPKLEFRPFRATIEHSPRGNQLSWGCPYRPGILRLDTLRPPLFDRTLPDPKLPGSWLAQIRSCGVTFSGRNDVCLFLEEPENSQDIFLAVRISIPHGLKHLRPIEVHSTSGFEPHRLFCDYSQSWKLADGRSLLDLWSFVRVDNGDSLRLLHVLPHDQDLSTIVANNRAGKLRFTRQIHTKNAAPFPAVTKSSMSSETQQFEGPNNIL